MRDKIDFDLDTPLTISRLHRDFLAVSDRFTLTIAQTSMKFTFPADALNKIVNLKIGSPGGLVFSITGETLSEMKKLPKLEKFTLMKTKSHTSFCSFFQNMVRGGMLKSIHISEVEFSTLGLAGIFPRVCCNLPQLDELYLQIWTPQNYNVAKLLYTLISAKKQLESLSVSYEQSGFENAIDYLAANLMKQRLISKALTLKMAESWLTICSLKCLVADSLNTGVTLNVRKFAAGESFAVQKTTVSGKVLDLSNEKEISLRELFEKLQ